MATTSSRRGSSPVVSRSMATKPGSSSVSIGRSRSRADVERRRRNQAVIRGDEAPGPPHPAKSVANRSRSCACTRPAVRSASRSSSSSRRDRRSRLNVVVRRPARAHARELMLQAQTEQVLMRVDDLPGIRGRVGPAVHARPETARRCRFDPVPARARGHRAAPTSCMTAGALEVDRAAMGAATREPAPRRTGPPAAGGPPRRFAIAVRKLSLARGVLAEQRRQRLDRGRGAHDLAQIEVHRRGQDMLRGPADSSIRGSRPSTSDSGWHQRGSRPWRRRDRAEIRPRSGRRSPRRPARRSMRAAHAALARAAGSAYTRPLS